MIKEVCVRNCCKCGDVKSIDLFVSRKVRCSRGKGWTCKICANKHKRENQNKESKAKSDSKYYLKNKEKITTYKKQWATDNKNKVKTNHLNWRKDNSVYKKKVSDSQKRNRDKINKYKLAWHHDKYKNDPLYKLKCRARYLIKRSFTDFGINKNSKSFDILGFTVDDLVNHLNKGEYTVKDYAERSDLHIDHIIPMSYFVKLSKLKSNENPENIIKKANSLENLRIITDYDNLSKANKICIPLINKYKLHHLLT